MKKNRKSAAPEKSVLRDAKEVAAVEQYWHAAGRPKSRKPTKDYKYVDELAHVQFELIKLQEWVRLHGLKVVVIFEGRDAAGKGGVIKRITQSLNPRICRVVALGTPTSRERGQWYFQRYIAELPTRGEIVLFDRSWYNRAGVEYVMGFCTPEQHERFLKLCPQTERYIVDGGIKIIKIWLEVSDKEQKRRFEARMDDPLRQWKLSPMDLPSREKWFQYSRARDMMLKATDTKWAPWHILHSDDKKRARLNCIRHILDQLPYKKVPRDKIKLPKRSMKGAYDDQATLRGRKFVPVKY
jgi:polyphosphate kinase 2